MADLRHRLMTKAQFSIPDLRFRLRGVCAGLLLAPTFPLGLNGATAERSAPLAAEISGWVEPNFPFFSSVLDARKAGDGLTGNNLTPRGLVLNLGQDCWVAFDPDLLRVSAVWRGPGVSPRALAPGSYLDGGPKSQPGQKALPLAEGQMWLANGLYPGWQSGERLSLTDPREPAPSPEEVGRGPMAESLGRFGALRLAGNGVVLEYVVAGTGIRETWTVSASPKDPIVIRHLQVASSREPLALVLGEKAPGVSLSLQTQPSDGPPLALVEEAGVWSVRLPAHPSPLRFAIVCRLGEASAKPPALGDESQLFDRNAPALRWPGETVTSVTVSSSPDAYVVDRIELPEKNAWKRHVRPCDIQFLPDGTAVLVTLDGDVWLGRGLQVTAGTIRWKRFSSGLHEPMSIAIRDGEIFAFDRNGIWRLLDTDRNGEADVHELFSNAFAQTADMREFPSTIRLAPRGEFVIAKGGQEDTTLGKHNGSVLRISADGRTSTVLGYGFRQPSVGVNVRTGLVTSSDQQGQYIPSTPLHIVRDRQFYGFLPRFVPREKYPAPIAEPLTWIPHSANASAVSQVWLFDARMGPLDDGLVHIGFNKPEVFRVLLNDRGSRLQASVFTLTADFPFPLLNGSVNPADGQLYIAGFQIMGWGNVVDALAGLARVRYTGAPVTVPKEIVPMDRGVLLRFEVPLDPAKARDPDNYSLQTWSYRRTHQYGSAQYKEDGTTGQDTLTASSAYLSSDGRSVFVGVPGMKPVMQLRLGWALSTAEGRTFSNNAYTTPYELAKFDPAAEGFGTLAVDLSPREASKTAAVPVSVDEGKRLSQLFACVACHAVEKGSPAKSGPTWKGLFGTQHNVFVSGKVSQVTADKAYLHESILEPAAKLALGFEKGEYAMPSYAGVLGEPQIQSLIAYIESLR